MTEKFMPLTMREVMNPNVTQKQHKINEENYWSCLRRQKEETAKRSHKVIFEPKWPAFDNNEFSQPKLVKKAEHLVDFLEKNDIPFQGVFVVASMKKSDTPEFVIFMNRSTRSLVFANDIPEVHCGIEVSTRIVK